MEGFPRCLFGCCAVDVGDAEGRCLFGDIASEGEEVLGVCYELVLCCDAFVDEKSSVSGFVWTCKDGGDGVAYGGCPGDAEWDVASIDDYGAAVSVAQCTHIVILQQAMINDTIPSAVLAPTLMMNGTLLSPQSIKGPVISRL